VRSIAPSSWPVPASGPFELAIKRGRKPEWRCALSDVHLLGCGVTGNVCDTRALEGSRGRLGAAGAAARATGVCATLRSLARRPSF
jgi:hypothetical protein